MKKVDIFIFGSEDDYIGWKKELKNCNEFRGRIVKNYIREYDLFDKLIKNLLVKKGLRCCDKNYKGAILDVVKELKPFLSDKDNNIIDYIFFNGYEVKEVAEIFGVTRSRIYQLKNRVDSKLRKICREKYGF